MTGRRHRRGLTLVEMAVTMAVFTLVLVLSAGVVDRYYRAYALMDTSLPSERSLAHNLEALMRRFSKIHTIYEPTSKELQKGFAPTWEEGDESLLLRFKLVEAGGEESFCSLGYSKKESGLLLVEYVLSKEDLEEPRHQVFKTGPLTLRATRSGRQTLLTLRLDSTTPGRLPLQTTIVLKDLQFEPLPKKVASR